MQEFTFIETLDKKHIDQLYALHQQMWWSEGRSMDDILKMLKNCVSFGIIENESQDLIGYARVLTDEIKYAFIFDVMLSESYRKKGLGKMLMDKIISHPRLVNIKNFELTCAPEMVAFYEKFGFSEDYGVKSRPMRFSRSHS